MNGLARNLTLPALPFWLARSFYAQLLLLLTVAANAAGIDLFAYLGAMGIGSTPDEVLASGDRLVSAWQQIAPLVFGLWAWLERRAPNYRLSVPKGSPSTFAMVLLVGMALAFALLPTRSMADSPRGVVCMREADYRAMLAERYGEALIWTGDSDSYRFQLLRAASGSWTLLMINPGGKACNLGGGDRSTFQHTLTGA